MKKQQLLKTILVIILLLNVIAIYFFDSNYDFFGIVDFEDLLSLINFSVFVVLQVLTKGYKYPKNNFKKWLIFVSILCLFSSIQSYILYNQSIIQGFLAQKEIISMSLLYFPLSKIINNDLIDIKKVERLIDKLAILQLILFISQYLLSSKITFLIVHTAYRYDDIRYYFDPILLDWFLIRNLNNLVNGKTKIKSIIYILLVLFETMVVQKYRLTSFALILIVIMGLFIGKTNVIKKAGYVFLAIIFSTFMINTRLVQDLISEITVKNKTFTYSIRETGRTLYLNTVNKHPILGGGYPKNYESLMASGYFHKIILSDNGVFGFMYLYGLLGLLWYITLWFKMIFKGFKIFRKNNNIVYLLFPTFFLMTCINELHWYWHHGFIIFVLFLTLFEKELSKVEN